MGSVGSTLDAVAVVDVVVVVDAGAATSTWARRGALTHTSPTAARIAPPKRLGKRAATRRLGPLTTRIAQSGRQWGPGRRAPSCASRPARRATSRKAGPRA